MPCISSRAGKTQETGFDLTLYFAGVLAGYFCLLLMVAQLTSRKRADNAAFFVANKSSKWSVVAFGMIGVALSGVTFISVPGAVGGTNFSYFQLLIGSALGFIIIAFVLLPIY